MGERSLGHIATTSLNTAGPNLWGLVLTDRRTILVRLFTDWSMYGGAGGALPALLATATADLEPTGLLYGYWDADPDALAADRKSILIEHGSVAEWRLQKRRFDDAYRIHFLYDDGGRRRKRYGTILWTAAVPQMPARSDPARRVTCLRQARAVRGAYAQVLPPSVMARFRGVE